MAKRRLPARGLDSFRRTPARRYDLPPQEETRAEHASRFRKRYFDIPKQIGHAFGLKLCRERTVKLCSQIYFL